MKELTIVAGKVTGDRRELAMLAVQSLIEEAELTPKPGLVDRESSGAHTDLDIDLMLRSAHSLTDAFAAMVDAAVGKRPDQELREELAQIGREGERAMFQATGGTNTHKGAIWALGLLVAGAAIHERGAAPEQIAMTAGTIARYRDRWAPVAETNGSQVCRRYGVTGAVGEAQNGFPHVIDVALPTLHKARQRGMSERYARLDTLVSLIVRVEDTCLLHRGGIEALTMAQTGAREILAQGGASTAAGWEALKRLDVKLLERRASPGGSADLLAATLFLDRVSGRNIRPTGGGGNGNPVL
ncbi:triphosphoribosyl-dephospho-CoA synthase [Desmospora activa]|nr:triphosphoribosyl-dephospho-CoA synthase [Desmospora activa]